MVIDSSFMIRQVRCDTTGKDIVQSSIIFPPSLGSFSEGLGNTGTLELIVDVLVLLLLRAWFFEPSKNGEHLVSTDASVPLRELFDSALPFEHVEVRFSGVALTVYIFLLSTISMCSKFGFFKI